MSAYNYAYNREKKKAFAFAAFLLVMALFCLITLIGEFDFSQPVLSERNPNGTIDYWYIGSNANKGN